MTGSTDTEMASIDRRLERDPEAKAKTLRLKAFDLENYNEAVLKIARPVIVEVLELYAAAFQVTGSTPEASLRAALGVALQDPGLYRNFAARVKARQIGLSEECLRMSDQRGRDVLDDLFGAKQEEREKTKS